MAACVLGSALAFPAACAVFPDLSELQGASDDGGGDGPGQGDAARPDASSDAPVTADAGTWCAAHAPAGSVCFDFDEPFDASALMPQASCQTTAAGCNATVLIEPDTRSPPNAVVMGLPALDPYPSYGKARELFSWPSKPGTVMIGFDLRIDNPKATGILGMFEWNTVIYSIDLSPPSFVVRASDYAPDSGVGDEVYKPLASMSTVDFTAWHRFELTVSRTSNQVTLVMDGATLITDTTRGVPLTSYVAYTWGVDYVNGPQAATGYHYDNVVLLATP